MDSRSLSLSPTFHRKAFIGTMIVVAVAGICSSLSPSYKLFLVSRCMLGFGVGGGQVFAAWFMEFIPTANRGVWVIALTSFWSFGSVVEALLAWVYIASFAKAYFCYIVCFPLSFNCTSEF